MDECQERPAELVIKHLGHGHLPRRLAPVVNEFTQRVLSSFLNSAPACSPPIRSRRQGTGHEALPRRAPPQIRRHLRPARRPRPRRQRPRRRPRAQRRPQRTVPHHRAHLERCGLTSHPTHATPPPDHARAVDLPGAVPFPPLRPLVCPIAAASTFGFQTDQGLHRSFVHFNIALPFTHFPTPTTAPSTSHLQAHLRIGKDLPDCGVKPAPQTHSASASGASSGTAFTPPEPSG